MIFPLSLFAQDKNPTEFPIVSYKNLEVKELNESISAAEKGKELWVFHPLSIAMRFHEVSDVRFVNIKQKNSQPECPLKSVVTIVEEGFLDDQLRGRWTEFHLERRDCKKAWNITEIRQAYLCGMEGSEEVFLKEICPKLKSGKVTDVWVEMSPDSVEVPCDYFPYTFEVKFKITVNGPATVTFQRIRSDGAKAPLEEIIFSEAGTKEFEDYYRVGEPGDYWFGVEIISPNKVFTKAESVVRCRKKIMKQKRKEGERPIIRWIK